MPRVPPPCFRRKLLGSHTSVADVVRTYIPQVGYLFSSFDTWYALRLYSHVRKRKHSTAQQYSKNNENETEKLGGKIIPIPFRAIIFCLIGTPYTRSKRRRKKNEQKSFSLSASHAARPSRDRLAIDSVRVKLSSISATVSLVARLT